MSGRPSCSPETKVRVAHIVPVKKDYLHKYFLFLITNLAPLALCGLDSQFHLMGRNTILKNLLTMGTLFGFRCYKLSFLPEPIGTELQKGAKIYLYRNTFMKLIKKLDMRWNKSGTYKSRWGLFLCHYCNRKVEKNLADGLKIKSCGCARYEIKAKTQTIHGQTPKKLYQRWQTLKTRCYNPNNPSYKDYGAKGIKVCAEWRYDYQPFKEWALKNGYRDELALCRKDVKKDYIPENCHFAKEAQSSKRRTTTKMRWDKVRNIRQLYKNESMSQDQLGKKFKICSSTVSRIVNNKLWIEE